MLKLWTILIAAASAQKVFDSTEDIGPEAFQNVTTLYPIQQDTNKTKDNSQENQTIEINNNVSNETNSTEDKDDKSKIDATIWKIEAAYTESNLEDKHETENVTKEIDKANCTKEFRPSQHLGNFYDEDNFRVNPSKASVESFVPMKKPAGFVSIKDDFRSSFTKIPKHILQTHTQYPYKFETPVLTRIKDPWSQDKPDSLESQPTIESPARIPAGGFYKYEDPFREKPSYGYDELFQEKPQFPTKDGDPFRDKPGSGEEFGLSFIEDGKEGETHNNNSLKKRESPWESFVRVVTAFLPVGLIIAALTPTLVTIESTQPGPPGPGHAYPNLFRRADPAASALAGSALAASSLPAISERCRRRLLCELHSDYNFKSQSSPARRGKHCYKIHCEDTDALEKTLRWLLQYRRTQNGHYT